ncbi:polysaccharide biosynthesis protein [Catenovulum agarivorans DS-2]|uniref:Polysaccharide biosynthesis protein n=1 Tax=Catenovulum agarivorans DS-2 TaxID=1328313 RepID=W7QTH5_9ALTE|nr:oligosaccharide flippase family protein [Catenovulum agarivorans]EWH11148.1 polysaccharide biosynthesis protein [Catenovulum agarivorans DS-2]
MTLASKVAKSTSLVLAVRLFQRSVGIISLLILARLLTPQDFGIVAIATMLVFLFDTLSEGGTQQYIIQKKSLDELDVITAWTISILSKLVLFVALLFSAPVLADFLNAPEAEAAIRVMALVLPISAVGSPKLFLHRRDLEYGIISKILLIDRVVSFTVTIALAFYLQTYWAMVYGVLAAYTCKTLLSHYYAPYPIKFSLIRLKEQMSFSLWMFLRSILGYIRAEFDIIFVSKLYGADQLGGFSLMRNLSYLPSREIISPVSNVFLASFSEIKRRGDHLGDHVVMVLTILLFAITPVIGYLHVFNQDLVSIFLGEQWLVFSHLLPLLSVFTITFAISTFIQQGLISNGDVKLLSIYDMVTLSALLSLFTFFFTGNIEEFIGYRIAFSFLTLGILIVFSFVRFRLPIFSLLFIFSQLASACYLSVYLSELIQGEGIAHLIIGSSIYFASYIFICLVLLFIFQKHRILKEVIAFARRVIRAKFKKSADN